jgi:NADH-quinone oxidoreductase subunit M
MQSVVLHHTRWTILATTGVILTASYMLWMVQRVFYGDLNHNTEDIAAPDLDAREHIALWPMVALMLLMGVASPYWLRAIDTAGTALATAQPEPSPSSAATATCTGPGMLPIAQRDTAGRCIYNGFSRAVPGSQPIPFAPQQDGGAR